MKRGRTPSLAEPQPGTSKRPRTPMGEREAAFPSQAIENSARVPGGIPSHSGPESNTLHPSGRLYPQSSSQPAHGGGEQQHIPSILVDRGPLVATDGRRLGRYPLDILAGRPPKDPGSAGAGEAFSSPRVGLSTEAEPSDRDHKVEGIYSPGPRNSQLAISSVPQGSSTSHFGGAHNFTIETMNTPSIGRDQVNYTTNVYQGGTAPANLSELRGKIRKWLKAPSYHEIHTTAIDQRTDNTGMWFLNLNQFQQLKKGGGCVLWCTGMPGSGKTILASISIEHLEDSFKSETNVAVVYAYLRYSEKHSLRDVFAALLDQLLEHDVVVTKVAPSYSEKSRKGVACTSEKVTWHILKDAIGSLFKVFAVIDGLDEADDEVKDGLLEALPSIGINVLILSRPLEPFTHHTPNALRVSIQAQTEDIALYINEQFRKNSRLRALLGGRPELATELSTRIKTQADGMFLLARLQLESVMRDSISAKTLFECLEKLPSGINAMYCLTVQRINDQPLDIRLAVHRLFTWLLYKQDYPGLNVQDLQYALAVSVDSQTFDERAIISEDLLLSACHGLVVVSPTPLFHNRPGTMFRFIHYSAQEFLRGISLPTIPHPQAFIAATCLVFATQHANIIRIGVPKDSDRSFHFLDYAYTNYGEHAQSSQQLGEPLHPSIIPSLLQFSAFPFLLELGYELPIPTLYQKGRRSAHETAMVPSLTVASMYGLVDVVKSGSLPFPRTFAPSLDLGPKPTYPILSLSTPFHGAALFGQFDTFIALLSTYGTRGIPLWTPKEDCLPPILHTVVESPSSGAPFLQRLFDIVDNPPTAEIRLALSEFDINAQDPSNGNLSALGLACRRFSREDVVRLLLSRPGVEVNLPGNFGDSIFLSSVSLLECGTALLLLRHFPKMDIETASGYAGHTPLIEACRYGHQEVTEYIRTKRRDEWTRLIQRTDKGGKTALMWCSVPLQTRGPQHEAIMRTLIEDGSNLHARETREGMTTFLHAIRYRGAGDPQILVTHILKPLLEYDPSAFDQRDNHGRTALMLELCNHKPDEMLLKFLISLHPFPEQYLNLRDVGGHSALMHALGGDPIDIKVYKSRCNDGRVDAVKILLANPALDICMSDQIGRGILEVTCSAKWLFTWEGDKIHDSFFPMLDVLLPAKDGWDISLIRKAVIAAGREMSVMAVYRLLLEDWVAHSFAWNLDDTDTVILLAQISTRKSSCRALVSVVLHRLGFLEPSVLASGIDMSDPKRLPVKMFCRTRDCGDRDRDEEEEEEEEEEDKDEEEEEEDKDGEEEEGIYRDEEEGEEEGIYRDEDDVYGDEDNCRWHSDRGIEVLLPQLFSNRESYTQDKLKSMIPTPPLHTQHPWTILPTEPLPPSPSVIPFSESRLVVPMI